MLPHQRTLGFASQMFNLILTTIKWIYNYFYFTPPQRIAFAAKARSGKDTAAEYLQKRLGGRILHFSDPLKDIMHYAQTVCKFPHDKDVEFLQWIGTDWARKHRDSVWVDLLIDRVPKTENCYVADVRFPNELEALKQHGFKIVHIVRHDRPIDRNTKHESENALSGFTDWDYTIHNDGTIESFTEKLAVHFC